jgi:signal transduction histidine kinase
MKRKLTGLSRRYVAALRKHLKQGPQASLQPALGLGRQAAALDLETLDMARIHEGALATLEASSSKDGIIKRAEMFFAEAVTPIEKTHCAALKANARLSQLNKMLGRRTMDLAASNRFLLQGIAQRKTVEKALKKSAGHYAWLVKKSHRLQKHLRHLTRQLLSAQEEERKKISRELHDEVAQTLLGINVRLLTVKQSVKTMNRFAREFGKQHDT